MSIPTQRTQYQHAQMQGCPQDPKYQRRNMLPEDIRQDERNTNEQNTNNDVIVRRVVAYRDIKGSKGDDEKEEPDKDVGAKTEHVDGFTVVEIPTRSETPTLGF